MHPGLTLGGLTHTKGGWASILTITAGINWAALGSWIGSQNWAAISTTIGIVIFNVAVGVTAAVNYYHAGRAKHRREQEELDKDSWSARLARMTRERDEARDEVADLNRENVNLKEDVERLESQHAELREAAHKQRGELNRQVLEQVNEANEMRDRIWQLNREIEALKALNSANNQPTGGTSP